MPKAAVRANARSLSKSKSRRGAIVPAFNLNHARANWQAAVAEYDAASQGYVRLCDEMEAAARAAAVEHPNWLAVVYDEEAKLARAMDTQDAAASAILAAPASIEAIHLKLALFHHLWAKERGIEQPLNG
jgi:hypothetical protein